MVVKVAWASAVVAAVVVGVVVALVDLPWPMVAVVMTFPAAAVATWWLGGPAHLRRGPAGVGLLAALALTACASVAAAGLVALTGLAGLALVLVLAGTSPPAVQWYRRRFPGQPAVLEPDPPHRGDALGDAWVVRARASSCPSPEHLSTEQLCLAWRRSFTAVERARDAAELVDVASERAGYLDELERRDRPGFYRWLANGARPASNPARYLDLAATTGATASTDHAATGEGLDPRHSLHPSGFDDSDRTGPG